MARYLEPRCKLCRHAGVKLFLKGERCLTSKCAMEKRSTSLGRRTSGWRRRVSGRGLQLREKQKARYTYGMMERQFRRFFAEAEKARGATGENFVQLLERRLDNVVYRLHFADSCQQARQLVNHGHIEVNGHKVDIPSYLVRPGDVVGWTKSGSKTDNYHRIAEEITGVVEPSWLLLDKGNLSARVLTLPTRSEIKTEFNENAIVEYYSR